MEDDKKHLKDCSCIFCKSKCPKCGSTQVAVTVRLEYEYSNKRRDHITVLKAGDGLKLKCRACGARLALGEGLGTDRSLRPLIRAIFEAMELPCTELFQWTDDGIRRIGAWPVIDNWSYTDEK